MGHDWKIGSWGGWECRRCQALVKISKKPPPDDEEFSPVVIGIAQAVNDWDGVTLYSCEELQVWSIHYA